MDKRLIISWGIVLILILGICFLISRIFSGNKTSDQKLVKQLVSMYDSIAKKENEKVNLYERLIEEKDRTNEVLQNRDSILNAHYAETEITYKKIKDELDKIPVRISRISTNADSIRSAFREF